MNTKVEAGYMEGAPVVVCRPWRFGDERRGLRGAPCMVARCPHTLAVTGWRLGTGYICLADAESYGLVPKGTARHDATEAGRDLA
jgi:hypothetical protein